MYEKIVLVTRKTRLQQLVERFNSRGQARFYIEHAGGDFADYQAEDDAYLRSLEALHRGLDLGLKVQQIERAVVPTFLFAPTDLVVALGKEKRGQKTPVDGLDLEPHAERAVELIERAAVDLVLAQVLGEVPARVLDVELRLGACVEPLDELRQPRLASDQHDLVEARHVTFRSAT